MEAKEGEEEEEERESVELLLLHALAWTSHSGPLAAFDMQRTIPLCCKFCQTSFDCFLSFAAAVRIPSMVMAFHPRRVAVRFFSSSSNVAKS